MLNIEFLEKIVNLLLKICHNKIMGGKKNH
jgi:hypothetical protein